MLTIDADAHVLETEKTWEYMDGAHKNYRPKQVGSSDGDSKDEYWLVDGTLRLKSGNVGRNTPQASREMRDVATRLKHMDELGVTIQVLYPTLFLIPLTPRPEVELALCRSYNRWLAGIWKQAQERLRWAAVVPLMSMEQTLAEARFAKEVEVLAAYVDRAANILKVLAVAVPKRGFEADGVARRSAHRDALACQDGVDHRYCAGSAVDCDRDDT